MLGRCYVQPDILKILVEIQVERTFHLYCQQANLIRSVEFELIEVIYL